MPVNPFTTYNSNQRAVSIPITPQQSELLVITGGAGTRVTSALKVPFGAGNTATNSMMFYLHSAYLTLQMSALAQYTILTQVQFLNAALAVVSGPINLLLISASTNNATGVSMDGQYYPAVPYAQLYTALPATAVWAQFTCNVFAVTGAPTAFLHVCYTFDNLNVGPTGSMGGMGMIAQSANNPNTF